MRNLAAANEVSSDGDGLAEAGEDEPGPSKGRKSKGSNRQKKSMMEAFSEAQETENIGNFPLVPIAPLSLSSFLP